MLLFGISVSNYIWPWGQKVKGQILIKYAHFGRYGGKEENWSIFWYMIELRVLNRGNQLPLQSDARFSSYKGSEVGFDTFLAISLCVYIGAHNNFRTKCPSSKGTFLIETVMSSEVIQGRLWAKSCQLMLIFATTSSDQVWHRWNVGTNCEWSRGTFSKITVMWSKVTKGQLLVNYWSKCVLFLVTSCETPTDRVRHGWFFGTSCEWDKGSFSNIMIMWSKVNKGQ